MGAPSFEHERRVADLRTLGRLSGHLRDVRLARYEVPDVVLADIGLRRLFVADAKSTETSAQAETRARLRSYRSASRAWRRAAYSVRLTLCVGVGDTLGWSGLLADLEPGGVDVRHQRVGPYDELLWIDLGPLLDDVPSGKYRRARVEQADCR